MSTRNLKAPAVLVAGLAIVASTLASVEGRVAAEPSSGRLTNLPVVGAQGASPAPGALLPRTLPEVLDRSARALKATTTARGGDTTRLDAVVLQPLVSRLVLGGHRHGTALLRSAGRSVLHRQVAVPGTGRAEVWSYDGRGRLWRHRTSTASVVPVPVAPGGVTIVRR